MKTYNDNLILQFDDQTTGNAASGELVTVFNAGLATKPAIFDVFGSPIANPLTTDVKGNFAFQVVDGIYDVVGKAGTPDETRRDRVEIIKQFSGEGNFIASITLAQAIADLGAVEGKVVRISDRGNALFEYKTGQTPNTRDVVAADAVGLDLVLDVGMLVDIRAYGVLIDVATDASSGITFANAANVGGAIVMFPAGKYRVGASTIRLLSGVTMMGANSDQNNGTVFEFNKDDGTDCFDSDVGNFLGSFNMQNFHIVNIATVAGDTGGVGGSAFKLFGVTNNSSFSNVVVRNFRGDGWEIGKQTLNPSDLNAVSNTTFYQCFVVSCGGFGFNIDGFINAVWVMPDLNSCVLGGFRFANGTNNQSIANIIGLWWEGTQSHSAANVVIVENGNGQPINFVGANFVGGANGVDVVKTSGTGTAKVTFTGCTGFNFTNAFNDTVSGLTIPFSSYLQRAEEATSRSLVLEGNGSFLDIFDRAGPTANQRRFRTSIAANFLNISARDDAGASVRNVLQLIHSSGDVVAPSGKIRALGGLGVGNSAAATTLGSVTKKIEVFDENGSSIGFLPVYDSIT